LSLRARFPKINEKWEEMTDITGLLEKSKKGKRFHCSVLIPNNFHFSIKSERLIVENPSFFLFLY